MAKIELKAEELVGLLQKLLGDTESPGLGQEAPRRSAEQHLGMFQELRAANPVQSPAPPGTITQARRQADESAKLQREQMAQQERLARLSRARSGGGGGGLPSGIGQIASLIKATTDVAAKDGRSFSDVVQALRAPASLDALQQYGISVDQAIEMAKQYYEPTLNSPGFAANTHEAFNFTSGEMSRRMSSGVSQDALQRGQSYPNRDALYSAALQDLQKYSPQVEPQHMKEGAYRDPATGEIYYIDKWGNKVSGGTASAGVNGGLGGLGR